MLPASRILSRADAGEPLPVVFRMFEARGIKPRRGQITMIAGQTNSGKSAFALYYCLRLAQKGEHVVYMSADSDEHTQGTRLAAAITGHDTDSIEESIPSGGLDYYEDELASVDIRFDFTPNPSLEDVETTLLAYEEMYGRYPSVLVIDNLINVEGFGEEGSSEKHGLIQIQKTIKYLCRETNVAVLLLHHCSEAEGKPNQPPTRKAVIQKVNELPENILTVAYDDATGRFGVAAVKLRNGRADAGARDPVWLWADLARCRFGDSKHELVTGVAV